MDEDLDDSSDAFDVSSNDEWSLISVISDEDVAFSEDSAGSFAGDDKAKKDFISLLQLAHEKVNKDSITASESRNNSSETEFYDARDEQKTPEKNDGELSSKPQSDVGCEPSPLVTGIDDEILTEGNPPNGRSAGKSYAGGSLQRRKRKKCPTSEAKKKSKGLIKKKSKMKENGSLVNGVTKCSVCEREFHSLGRLKVHMRIHETSARFSCERCKKTYKRSKNFDSHVCVVEFPCKVCGKIFATKAGCKQHEQTHNEEKNYECSICGKTFHVSGSLCAHMVTHATIKPYKCEVCGKSFAKQHNLRIHTRTHTKEKPFECQICKKSFTQRCNLNAHSRIHYNEHPYVCQFCGRCFTHKSTLKSHVRSHTKEKPYQCTICKKQFSHRRSLFNHHSIHTKEKKFACKYCDMKFAHRQSWNYHEKLHAKAGDQRKTSGLRSELLSGIFSNKSNSAD